MVTFLHNHFCVLNVVVHGVNTVTEVGTARCPPPAVLNVHTTKTTIFGMVLCISGVMTVAGCSTTVPPYQYFYGTCGAPPETLSTGLAHIMGIGCADFWRSKYFVE